MMPEQTAPALDMMMRGVQAFESRDLKMALAAFSAAQDLAGPGQGKFLGALGDAMMAVKRDDRKALLAAVVQATSASANKPAAKPAPVNGRAARPAPPREPPARADNLREQSGKPDQAQVRAIAAAREQAVSMMAASAPAIPMELPPHRPDAAPPAVSRTALLLGEGEHAARRGDLAAALDALDHAMTVCRDDPDAEDLAAGTHFSRLGALLAKAGAWAEAGAALRQALKIKTRHIGKSNRRLAGDLTLLSAVCEREGRYEEALRLAERGVSIRRLQSNARPEELAASLRQYGLAALWLEDFAAAAAAFREAVALGRKSKVDEVWLAGLLDELGLALARVADTGAALELHQEAYHLKEARLPARHPDIGRSLLYLGGFLMNAGEFADAETQLRAALEIFEAGGPEERLFAAQSLESLAVLQVRRQQLEPARQTLASAVTRVQAMFGPDHRKALGFEIELAFLTLFTGDLAGAAALGLRVLLRLRQAPNGTLRQDVWYLLSQLALARRELAAAIVFGKLAAQPRHSLSGARLPTPLERLFGGRPSDLYRHLAGMLAKTGRLAEANSVLTVLKENELFEMLRRDPATDPRRSTIALTPAEANWQGLGEDILRDLNALSAAGAPEGALLAKRQAAAENRYQRWLESAEIRCAALALPADGRHPGLAALGARVGLLQIVPGPQDLHLFLTTTEFQISRDVAVGEPALRRLVLSFRRAIDVRAEGIEEMARELYDWLIRPIERTYRELGIKTLLIAAEGAVRYLPFAALHDGEKFLAETTATVLFTEAVAYPAAPRAGTASLAGFAAAGYGDEVTRLARETARRGVKPGMMVFNEEFCAASLAEGLASHHFIHLSALVALNPERPADSALYLGDGGRLAIRDLAVAPYYFRNVAMVALTGCETDPSAGGDASELEALGALLRWRGAETVLATLWRPPDDGPAALVPAFYTHRYEGRSGGMALNLAQRAVLAAGEAFRHPCYWAGYVVMGGIE